ncbi:HAD family hydrolase [Pendulispora albinea]|uniref:HAD-IA family hydrolase n=1 Tax=Pendulispora albinea TaxID=2741071 RepID=A0ABZ2M203_9BACT
MPLTLLFDLDGTLVDTDPLHFEAFSTLLKEYDKPAIDFEFYKTRIMGFGHLEIFSMLFPEQTVYTALAERKESLFRNLVRDLEPKVGLLDLLDWAKDRKLRCGVVTNAPRENAMLMLGALRLGERFETIVFGEELTHGKPHPMPYLTGLERLAGKAHAAIAFEDSLSGVRSASGAGIYTVGVRSSLSEEALRKAGASHTIEDFRDTALWSELRRHMDEANPTNGKLTP